MIGYFVVYIDYRDMKCVIYCICVCIFCIYLLVMFFFFFYLFMGDVLFFYMIKYVFLDLIILYIFIVNFDKKIFNEYYKYIY